MRFFRRTHNLRRADQMINKDIGAELNDKINNNKKHKVGRTRKLNEHGNITTIRLISNATI